MSEYQAGIDAIKRRRAIADAMQASAMSPVNAPMSGTGQYPIQTAVSPWQIAAQLGTAYVARKQNQKADKEYSDIASAMSSDRAKALANLQIPQDMAPASSSDEGPTHAPMASRQLDPSRMQAAIDAGIDPSVISSVNKRPTPLVIGEGSTAINPETGEVIGKGTPKPDYEPQKLARQTAADAEAARHNRATEGVAQTNASAKGKASFAEDEGNLMGALAERGVSLPAGLHSNGQMKATFRSLLDRNTDLTPDQIADKIASGQIDFNANKKSISTALSNFTSGKNGNTIRSLNVAVQHLDQLSELADALHNGDVAMINKAGNAVGAATGAAAPTNFEAAKKIVTDEVVKAIVGAGGTGGDREKMEAIINSAQSPEQLHGAIGVVQGLMTGQLNGLRQQYKGATNRDDFEDMLLPETRAKLEAHGQTHSAPTGAVEQTATNPQTGEKLVLRNGKWVSP